MVATIETVAFEGIEACPVEVQVLVASGLPAFNIVGLPDKAVTEARERVRAALSAVGLSLPPKRITVNLSPADRPKGGSHYDLPIALGVLVAMGAVAAEIIADTLVMGELGLDGSIRAVPGILPAAIYAHSAELTFVCPAASGPEAAWSGSKKLIAAPSLLALLNHLKGTQLLAKPEASLSVDDTNGRDLADVKGQESAKRALEVAAAGGHTMLMVGPPGSGKSMLASCMASLMPALTPAEALEVSMIASISGELAGGAVSRSRPMRAPHHSASQPAIIGGGAHAKPGEVSLAHNGVLFLDEFPEFSRATLEALRQPLENGQVSIARAQAHITYPARFQLLAAMNPCRCGFLADPKRACSRAPRCGLDYQSKISGPIYDRIDLFVDVPALTADELTNPPVGEASEVVAERVLKARKIQQERYSSGQGVSGMGEEVRVNAHVDGKRLEALLESTEGADALLKKAAQHYQLSARAYHRVQKVARTIADLASSPQIEPEHVAEALSYRRL